MFRDIFTNLIERKFKLIRQKNVFVTETKNQSADDKNIILAPSGRKVWKAKIPLLNLKEYRNKIEELKY
ncbi:hypothetical protein KUTeg_007895 [Tegillarca granosa]|uniref:Uncharacterized protein n=1 Tax=Tegillarca granosa TaxID=220873 RepID=A0ABQ9FHI4_TEGGR|nr:hypothetical protein KUTeg_007895 [Tegillarca granosa]